MKSTLLYLFFGFAVVSIAIPLNTVFEEKKDHQNASVEKHLENSTIYCAICEFLINYGEDYITKNTSVEEAILFLENLCEKLPKTKQAECDYFVENNYAKLIGFIVEKESASEVCSQLHFCDSYNMEITLCDYCKYATHRIERFLSFNNTLSDVIDFGYHFCHGMTDKFNYHCNYFISMYYSQVIGKLVDHYNFVDTCDSLKLCASS